LPATSLKTKKEKKRKGKKVPSKKTPGRRELIKVPSLKGIVERKLPADEMGLLEYYFSKTSQKKGSRERDGKRNPNRRVDVSRK